MWAANGNVEAPRNVESKKDEENESAFGVPAPSSHHRHSFRIKNANERENDARETRKNRIREGNLFKMLRESWERKRLRELKKMRARASTSEMFLVGQKKLHSCIMFVQRITL